MHCLICKFWEPDAGENDDYGNALGWCHRYPPITKPLTEECHGWPEVSANQWCGEFKAKENL